MADIFSNATSANSPSHADADSFSNALSYARDTVLAPAAATANLRTNARAHHRANHSTTDRGATHAVPDTVAHESACHPKPYRKPNGSTTNKLANVMANEAADHMDAHTNSNRSTAHRCANGVADRAPNHLVSHSSANGRATHEYTHSDTHHKRAHRCADSCAHGIGHDSAHFDAKCRTDVNAKYSPNSSVDWRADCAHRRTHLLPDTPAPAASTDAVANERAVKGTYGGTNTGTISLAHASAHTSCDAMPVTVFDTGPNRNAHVSADVFAYVGPYGTAPALSIFCVSGSFV